MPAALDHLKKRSEFLAVAGTNRRYTTPGLVLQVRPLNHDIQAETDGAEACPPRTAVRVASHQSPGAASARPEAGTRTGYPAVPRPRTPPSVPATRTLTPLVPRSMPRTADRG